MPRSFNWATVRLLMRGDRKPSTLAGPLIRIKDHGLARTKILLPMSREAWSASQRRGLVGGALTTFRVTGRLDDGHIVWRGWFDDREDFDRFLFAFVEGKLRREPGLWKLCRPFWDPSLGEHVRYDLATQTLLTTTPGVNATWTAPADWANGNNTVECIGGGASGAIAWSLPNSRTTGGGGGAYSSIANFVVATPGVTTATYQVALGGASSSHLGGGGVSGQAGNAAGVSWFNAASDPGAGTDNSKCSAQGGAAGIFVGTTGTQTGAAGGVDTAGWGQTRRSGGRGGSITAAVASIRTGGGAAAGNSAVGGNGVDSGTTGTATAGGQANGAGAAGSAGVNTTGSPTSAAGGNGTEYGTGGSGAGSGATRDQDTGGSATSGAGGVAGGGTGASACFSGTDTAISSAGGRGLIVVTYTPVVFTQALTCSSTGAASLSRSLGLSRSASSTGTASLARGVTKNLSASAIGAALLSRAISFTRSATAVGTAVCQRSVRKNIVAIAHGSASLIRQVGKNLTAHASGLSLALLRLLTPSSRVVTFLFGSRAVALNVATRAHPETPALRQVVFDVPSRAVVFTTWRELT